jgi:hypothetical protein
MPLPEPGLGASGRRQGRIGYVLLLSFGTRLNVWLLSSGRTFYIEEGICGVKLSSTQDTIVTTLCFVNRD